MHTYRLLSRCLLSVSIWLSLFTPSWAESLFSGLVLLGQAQEEGGASKYGVSWALILLSVVLGLMVTLKSSGRKSDSKRLRASADDD